MFTIGMRMLRDKAKTVGVFCLAAIGFLEMYIVLFPTIKSQASEFDKMMEMFPPEFFSAFNMDASSFSFNTLESYLSTEYMSFLWPIMAIALAIGLANYIIVNEIDKGTIESLCSLPISRLKIFFGRFVTGSKIIAFFSGISLLAPVLLAIIHGIDFKVQNYIITAVGSFLFMMTVYSMTTLISVFVSEKGKSTLVSSGILLLMYVINIVSRLKPEIADIKYLSIFNYFDGATLLGKGEFVQYSIVVLLFFIVISVVIAAVKFNKRDLLG